METGGRIMRYELLVTHLQCALLPTASHIAGNSPLNALHGRIMNPTPHGELEFPFFARQVVEPPETYGETILAVNQVPIRENGERLEDPRDLDPRMVVATARPWTRYPPAPWVREAVARMLAAAQEALAPRFRIQII